MRSGIFELHSEAPAGARLCRFSGGLPEVIILTSGAVECGHAGIPTERVVFLTAPGEPMARKSTVDEIRARFDREVERFSDLETGQATAVDSKLALELVAEAAAAVTPHARHLLDVGCGAGNYSLKVLERLPGLDVTLIDLSLPMLQRANERLGKSSARHVRAIQGDIRDVDLGCETFDIIVVGAVLHHLRADAEWEHVMAKLYRCLTSGGSLWIYDMVTSDIDAVQTMMWNRYGAYLVSLRDEAYRDEVFAYIEREDTPRSLIYQLDLMRRAGFRTVDVLHKNNAFALFGGVK